MKNVVVRLISHHGKAIEFLLPLKTWEKLNKVRGKKSWNLFIKDLVSKKI